MAAAEGLIPSSDAILSIGDAGQGQIKLENSEISRQVVSQQLQYKQESECGEGEASNESLQDDPILEININNVVCSFSTRCHLNLRRIALEGFNVEFKKENGMCNMKLRVPNVTASIWSSGKITCTGATSEDDSKIAARRIARLLQVMGFNVRFTNFRVVNVLGTCSLPFGIKITLFSRAHKDKASYEPELHPGVTYRIKEPKATLKIFSTGSITVTAPSVYNVQCAIEHIFPLVSEFKADNIDRKQRKLEQKYLKTHHSIKESCIVIKDEEEAEKESEGDDTDEESFDSDESQD